MSFDNTLYIYQIVKNKNIVDYEQRDLNDLSHGEKSIISLCFNSIRKIETEEKKILLLDEFDSVLNPSLIEKLFVVIKKILFR